MKVFIGLIEIAGRYKALHHGFNKLSVPSTLGLIYYNRYYSNEYSPILGIRILQMLYRLDAKAAGLPKIIQYPLRGSLRTLLTFLKIPYFLWAFAKHNVFIFASFSYFFYGLGYPILKLFGKKIIIQFHGSDSRPPYLDGRYQEVSEAQVRACIKLTKATKRRLRWVERYADVIINSPPQGYFHERPYVNRLLVGIPCGPFNAPSPMTAEHENESFKRDGKNMAVRVLHAPSDPKYKGTQKIREMLARLKEKGLKIEFQEISGAPNATIIDALQNCDLVVDQNFVDFAMPGLACEAAFFAKPTILAGNSVELWEELLPEDKRPPTFYCREEDFEVGIEKLILTPQMRIDLGKRAQKFITRLWAPETVAKNYLALASGKIPESWWVDPYQIPSSVVGGFFKPKELAQTMVREILAKDKDGLQLKDKPHLEKAFVEFAAEKNLSA